jgi:hypothetical protein
MGVGCCPKPALRTLSEGNAGVTQLVEYLPSKQAVASSSLVPRSTKTAYVPENSTHSNTQVPMPFEIGHCLVKICARSERIPIDECLEVSRYRLLR